MSDSNAIGPVNLGNPFELTVLDLAKIITKITDSKSEIVFKAQMQDDPMQRKPDIDLAKKLLDWTPDISLEIGLEKTINWMKGLNNARN
jgi:UDP-glucuronate decarboxylase